MGAISTRRSYEFRRNERTSARAGRRRRRDSRDGRGGDGNVLEENGDTRLDFFKKAGIAGGAVVSGGGATVGALAPGTALAQPIEKGVVRRRASGRATSASSTTRSRSSTSRRRSTTRRRRTGSPPGRRRSPSSGPRGREHPRRGAQGARSAARRSRSRSSTSGRRPPTRASSCATAVRAREHGRPRLHGQAFNIQSRAYLKVALTIATVEARHARRVRAAGPELGARDLARRRVRPRPEGEADPEHGPRDALHPVGAVATGP